VNFTTNHDQNHTYIKKPSTQTKKQVLNTH